MAQRDAADDKPEPGTARPGSAAAQGRSEADVYRLKVKELRALLREAGVTGTSAMRKDELVRELFKTMHSDQRARSMAKVATGKKSVVPPDDHAPSSRTPQPARPAKRVPSAAGVPLPDLDREEDVIDLLLAQHEQIADLFVELGRSRGAQRRGLFARLVGLLAVHESIEQVLVHPLARARLADGDAVVDARAEEEEQAEQDLAELHALGLEHDDFVTKLANLRDAVVEHAELEEEEEFDYLRDNVPAAELRRLADVAVSATLTALAGDEDGPDEAPPAVFARAREALHGA
ncbi:hemerythrin domain-containing protein [Catellatospora sp. NPDC049609]|uniref:hemerythrin domain-containing protein n=1 Tax=Catellatospora sp. NPDC049609 TaxID=3155505 RepID=UPI003421023F